jgi:hypothetical protein
VEGRQVKKAPAPTKTQGAFKNHTKHVDFTKPAQFLGTDNPRYLRAIQAVLTRPIPRQQLDDIAGCANGPDAILQIRSLFTDGNGKEHLQCKRINFIDRDGNQCRPGVYLFTTVGRKLVYAWIAKRGSFSNGKRS